MILHEFARRSPNLIMRIPSKHLYEATEPLAHIITRTPHDNLNLLHNTNSVPTTTDTYIEIAGEPLAKILNVPHHHNYPKACARIIVIDGPISNQDGTNGYNSHDAATIPNKIQFTTHEPTTDTIYETIILQKMFVALDAHTIYPANAQTHHDKLGRITPHRYQTIPSTLIGDPNEFHQQIENLTTHTLLILAEDNLIPYERENRTIHTQNTKTESYRFQYLRVPKDERRPN